MTKKHSTKKALLASVLSLLLCVSMLIGTTFAWFTDSVTSSGNKIVSGSLNIDMSVKENGTYKSVKEDSDAIFDYTLWEPGYTVWKNIKVSTTGNLALKYAINIVLKGERSILANVIDVYYAASEIEQPADRSLTGLTRLGTISEVLNGATGALINDTLNPADNDTEDYATIVLKMQESAGNDYQGKTIGEFDINLYATQYTYEEDSFDEQYDKDATYVSAETAEELKDAIAKGEPVSLTDDITMPAGNFTVAAGTEATINLCGNDLIVPSANAYDGYMLLDGDLTITGEGNVAVTQINTREGSKLTLGEGVRISTSNNYAILNEGTTVLDGATIEHTGGSNAIQNQYGTLIINDATVTSTSTSNISTINSTGGTVIINGGTFVHEGSMGSVIEWLYSDEGEIIINGGTFIQKGGESLASVDYGEAKLTINGGTFDSASYFAQPAQNIVINAGEFKNNAVVVFNPFMSWTIADKYVPATSTATTNADGSITVTVN